MEVFSWVCRGVSVRLGAPNKTSGPSLSRNAVRGGLTVHFRPIALKKSDGNFYVEFSVTSTGQLSCSRALATVLNSRVTALRFLPVLESSFQHNRSIADVDSRMMEITCMPALASPPGRHYSGNTVGCAGGLWRRLLDSATMRIAKSGGRGRSESSPAACARTSAELE